MGSGDVSNVALVKLLAGVGAVIFIILALIHFITPSLIGIVYGLLDLLVGIIVLISLFGSRKRGIPFTALFILVMGIVGCIIGYLTFGWIGLIAGILIFVAGIVGLL
ncbi:MAG: hypothetical protein ACFFDK_09100 [Promethearchaeota archaeon]